MLPNDMGTIPGTMASSAKSEEEGIQSLKVLHF